MANCFVRHLLQVTILSAAFAATYTTDHFANADESPTSPTAESKATSATFASTAQYAFNYNGSQQIRIFEIIDVNNPGSKRYTLEPLCSVDPTKRIAILSSDHEKPGISIPFVFYTDDLMARASATVSATSNSGALPPTIFALPYNTLKVIATWRGREIASFEETHDETYLPFNRAITLTLNTDSEKEMLESQILAGDIEFAFSFISKGHGEDSALVSIVIESDFKSHLDKISKGGKFDETKYYEAKDITNALRSLLHNSNVIRKPSTSGKDVGITDKDLLGLLESMKKEVFSETLLSDLNMAAEIVVGNDSFKPDKYKNEQASMFTKYERFHQDESKTFTSKAMNESSEDKVRAYLSDYQENIASKSKAANASGSYGIKSASIGGSTNEYNEQISKLIKEMDLDKKRQLAESITNDVFKKFIESSSNESSSSNSFNGTKIIPKNVKLYKLNDLTGLIGNRLNFKNVSYTDSEIRTFKTTFGMLQPPAPASPSKDAAIQSDELKAAVDNLNDVKQELALARISNATHTYPIYRRLSNGTYSVSIDARQPGVNRIGDEDLRQIIEAVKENKLQISSLSVSADGTSMSDNLVSDIINLQGTKLKNISLTGLKGVKSCNAALSLSRSAVQILNIGFETTDKIEVGEAVEIEQIALGGGNFSDSNVSPIAKKLAPKLKKFTGWGAGAGQNTYRELGSAPMLEEIEFCECEVIYNDCIRNDNGPKSVKSVILCKYKTPPGMEPLTREMLISKGMNNLLDLQFK